MTVRPPAVRTGPPGGRARRCRTRRHAQRAGCGQPCNVHPNASADIHARSADVRSRWTGSGSTWQPPGDRLLDPPGVSAAHAPERRGTCRPLYLAVTDEPSHSIGATRTRGQNGPYRRTGGCDRLLDGQGRSSLTDCCQATARRRARSRSLAVSWTSRVQPGGDTSTSAPSGGVVAGRRGRNGRRVHGASDPGEPCRSVETLRKPSTSAKRTHMAAERAGRGP